MRQTVEPYRRFAGVCKFALFLELIACIVQETANVKGKGAQ